MEILSTLPSWGIVLVCLATIVLLAGILILFLGGGKMTWQRPKDRMGLSLHWNGLARFSARRHVPPGKTAVPTATPRSGEQDGVNVPAE